MGNILWHISSDQDFIVCLRDCSTNFKLGSCPLKATVSSLYSISPSSLCVNSGLSSNRQKIKKASKKQSCSISTPVEDKQLRSNARISTYSTPRDFREVEDLSPDCPVRLGRMKL